MIARLPALAAILAAGFAAASLSPAHAQGAAADLGPAPDFAGIKGWLNGGPLTMQGLRGKVVLVDFWAYSCINCIRSLPYLEKWQKAYGDKGLQIVGVHTPEFRFETDPANIASAIRRFGINYPVAEDNDRATWAAFHNQYWPAEYLIDRQGRIIRTHFGEGEYDVTENAIRHALGVDGAVGAENGVDLDRIGSPEMYFGLNRVQNLASPEAARPGMHAYTAPSTLPPNRFALQGDWTLVGEHATLAKPGGGITLHFHSAKLFMVASSPEPVTIRITVDGHAQPDVTVQESRLYTLFDGTNYADHQVTIAIPQAGLSAFTFTFG